MSRPYSKIKKDFERRNLRRQQKLEVERYVFQTAFRDRLIKEIVCTNTPENIDEHMKTVFATTPQTYFAQNDGWRDGLVLVSNITYSFYQNMLNLPQNPIWVLEKDSE